MSTLNSRRVAIYVDGFNLYHAIDALGIDKLKWLNLAALGNALLRPNERLVKVHYFTTVVNWNAEKKDRHETYIRALQAKGVIVSEGVFKKSTRHCTQSGNFCPFREEKQTDVAIGVNIISDAYEDVFDRILLITADTDQIPTIEMIINRFPCKTVTWVAPPKRMQQTREIGQLVEDRFELSQGMIGTCRLPRVVTDSAGNIVAVMPNTYA